MRTIAAVVLLLGIVACDQPAPSAPPATSPSANQAPQIIAGTVMPALGIDELTTFAVRVEVRDPDADQVSLKVSGCSFGQDAPVTLENGAATLSFTADRTCGSSFSLTATDARGAAAQTAVSFQHTSLRGPYRLVVGQGFYDQPYFLIMLDQSRAVVTGTIRDSHGDRGTTDPQEPGVIDAEGRFRLRFTIESEDDLNVAGQVISAEFSLWNDVLVGTGTVIDGLHAGRTFQLWREAQY
jgi:hypothetical protein